MKSNSIPLIVNEPAYLRSSRGVRRYAASVLAHLKWDGPVRSLRSSPVAGLSRLWELCQRGSRSSILWTPCLRGPIAAHHHVITVHDCINVEFVYRNDWRRRAFIELTNGILRNAEVVVAISDATRAALSRNYRFDDSKVVVIRSGYEPARLPQGFSDAEAVSRNRDAVSTPYLLWVTNSLPHKNCERMAKALASINDRLRGVTIVVVGAVPETSEQALARAQIAFKVLRWIDDADLRELYRHCRFMISPSLDEGHNLAIAEAIENGANVLCSDIPAHREYYDGMASFFDPCSPESMAENLKSHLQRSGVWYPGNASRLRRTFNDVAADYARIFQSIEETGRAR